MDIKLKLTEYAQQMEIIASIRAELPQLGQAEAAADAIKKEIQEFVKDNGEVSGSGYDVKLSTRSSWDGKALDGYAKAHPEILEFKTVTPVATVKKAK